MNRTILVIGGLIAAAVLFFTVNILGSATLHGARLDLTQNHLYTLSKGSKNIAAKVDEPITVTLYYSERASADFPPYKSYSTRVREVLGELARASGGRIVVRIVNPEPFSDAEDAAVQAGLVAIPSGRGSEKFYFGLVGENSTDKREVIPLLDPSKEEFLEYDLTRIVYLLSNPQKKTIALMAQLPVEGMRDYPLARGQNIPAWKFVDALKDYFEVKIVTADKPEIPADAKVLVLVHPKTLSEAAQYAIDQFVMRGGHLLVFVDPYCEADLPPGINPMQAMNLPRSSHLEKLFDAWGIEVVPDRFAADMSKAVAIRTGNPPEAVQHLGYIAADKGCFSSTDPVTSELERLHIAIPGVIRKKPGASIGFVPLIETTPQSKLMDLKEVQFPADPKKLLVAFGDPKGDGQRLTIAARLSGPVNSAFPAGDPSKPADPGKPAEGHLSQSRGPAEIIVVADCDLLADRLWVQEMNFQGVALGFQKFADNGDFVIAAVDNLSGSSDLIGLRARGKFARPFDRIQQIQKEADQKFLAKVQELQAKRQQFEQEIANLINKAPPGAKVIIPAEDQARIAQLRKESAKINGDLRKIQYERNKDVERIGTAVKFVNIGLMPVLVGVAAVGLSAYRANRRRAWSRSVGARG